MPAVSDQLQQQQQERVAMVAHAYMPWKMRQLLQACHFLHLLQNEILKSVLGSCREVAVLASEEEDNALEVNPQGRYVVVFDPLDGSRNIDAAIPTGVWCSISTV